MADIASMSYFLLTISLVAGTTSITNGGLLPIVSNHETYIVHVEPHHNHTNELLADEELEGYYASFLPNTTLDSGERRLLSSYRHVISGFAAKLTREELRDAKTKEGFLLALPNRRHKLGTTYAPEFLGLDQGFDNLWAKSNEGEGVIIGIVDSGIRLTHVSFEDDGTMPEPPLKWRGCCQFNVQKCDPFLPSKCNNKLVGARAMGSIKSPADEIGHGTHVAGTAGGTRVYNAGVLGQARGTAVGMAPKAHLAMYRACPTDCQDKDILSAIDQAIIDGVDVLSLSIDSPDDFHKSSVIKGTFAAMEKGIFSSACAGNGGRYLNRLANDAPWILTVGASSMDRLVEATVHLGNGMQLQGETGYVPTPYNSPMLELEYPGVRIETDFVKACLSLNGFNLTGKIVVCETGSGDDVQKGKRVKQLGGVAMILLTQSWDGFTIRAMPHVLPAVHLSHADSLKVLSYCRPNHHRHTAKITFGKTEFGVRRAPAVGAFSSRGPSLINGGILKPDIVGPGVDIVAAWHKQVGPNPSGSDDTAFNFAYGCSMATPVLAGIAALLKKAHPNWSPAMIKSAIMTTARITDRTGQPIADEKSKTTYQPASFFAMGAGHVDPTRANEPGLVYDTQPEDYIGYLCAHLGQFYASIVTRKFSLSCKNYQNIEPEQLNYPSISVSMDSKSVKTINRTVTNVGVANSVYQVDVTAPDGVTVQVEPKDLKFSNPNEKQSYTVTFTKKTIHPLKGEYKEGQLVWKSNGSQNKYAVRSPISVEF